MSVAESVILEITHDAPRRPHAAVAALVGGPYPNLVTPPRPRPRLVGDAEPAATTTSAAPAPARAEPPRDVTPIDLRRRGDAGFPAGGPYPNLTTARR